MTAREKLARLLGEIGITVEGNVIIDTGKLADAILSDPDLIDAIIREFAVVDIEKVMHFLYKRDYLDKLHRQIKEG